MTGWIGIALGDFTGIGPEVALKALSLPKRRPMIRGICLSATPLTCAG